MEEPETTKKKNWSSKVRLTKIIEETGETKNVQPAVNEFKASAKGSLKTTKLSMQNPLENIETLQAHLWHVADNLRANSKLTANEYCMPVLGIIFSSSRHGWLQRSLKGHRGGAMPWLIARKVREELLNDVQ